MHSIVPFLAASFLLGCGSKQPESDGPPPVGSIGAQPDSAGAQSALLNTYWRITMLASTSVAADTGRRQPHLQLQESDGTIRYSATVGCNGVGGEATVEGNRVTFGPGMSTKMYCGDVLNALETQLHSVFTRSKQWSITGDTLELRDDAGTRLAQFVKAVPR